MAADERKQFALHELKDVLRALEELGFPCTLIGGQAVNCWAGLFLSGDSALQQFSKLASESLAGRKVAEKCSVDWRHILPCEIEKATEPELIALREKRLPRWLAKIERHQFGVSQKPLHRRMLDILAETAH